MKKKVERVILTLIGIFILFIGITTISYNFYLGTVAKIFWLCYIGMILIGIGILRKDSFLIVSQLNLISLTLILWTIDFFSSIIFGINIFGLSSYYSQLPTFWKIMTIYHIILLPLSFYALYLIKLERKDAWKISFVQVTIFYFIIKWFTYPEYNLNDVFHSGISFIPTLPYYPIQWFILAFLMIITTNFLINKVYFYSKDIKYDTS